MRKTAVGLIAAALVLSVVGTARAETSVTSERFWELVEDASTDPVALRELLEVESVDGSPYDVSAALGDGSSDEIAGRLETLASSGDPVSPRVPPREEAQRILADRRFQEPRIPRPLKGPIEWIGERLSPIGRFFGRIVESAARHIPGGEATLWIMLALLVAGLVTLGTLRYLRRAIMKDGVAERRARGREKPVDLERAAEKAEAQGDWSEAVRLRFRAGLIRLRAAEIVPDDDVVPNGVIADRLRLTTFARLAQTFDETHYGKHAATEERAQEARSGWKALYEQLAIR